MALDNCLRILLPLLVLSSFLTISARASPSNWLRWGANTNANGHQQQQQKGQNHNNNGVAPAADDVEQQKGWNWNEWGKIEHKRKWEEEMTEIPSAAGDSF
jgi:hypothetical protein